MDKIRCMIADDEILSVELLESYIRQLENYQVALTCRNGVEVFNALKVHSVDLLFLDIQMPKLTGIELMRSMTAPCPVIFTTAFREYAVEAYDFNAVDYLLKPISFDRFLKAIDKFESASRMKSNAMQHHKPAAEITGPPFLYIKSAKKTVKLFLKDILFFEGAKEFVKIRTLTGELITYQTLQYFDQMLPEVEFLRIHRSYIISVSHIRSYTASSVEVGDFNLPIGLSYQRPVAAALHM